MNLPIERGSVLVLGAVAAYLIRARAVTPTPVPDFISG